MKRMQTTIATTELKDGTKIVTLNGNASVDIAAKLQELATAKGYHCDCNVELGRYTEFHAERRIFDTYEANGKNLLRPVAQSDKSPEGIGISRKNGMCTAQEGFNGIPCTEYFQDKLVFIGSPL